MLQSFFNSWVTQNLITMAIIAVVMVAAVMMSRREYWRVAAREVCQKRAARFSFVILCIYAVVALLDSIGWRRPVVDASTGKTVLHASTGKPILDHGASALDYILKPISSKKETTYSAPLAERQFTTVIERAEDGSVARVHKALNYPCQHLLGTDIIGADVLALSLKSIRTGLIIGFLTTLIVIPFALFFGLCAGYYGGWADDIVQYLCTLISSIPSVLLIAALMLISGRGLPQLCMAVALTSWTGLCRLVRGEAIHLREMEYVQAARALGVSSWRIIVRHILPNLLHLVLINLVLKFSGLVLAEATLTYLGLGVSAETISWGTMINDARSELTRDPIIWWKLTSAFVFMLGLVLPANIFGDAVRDALDPRLRTQ
ncbi:MAG: ABC transporter permease [Victivallales bacterium]|nr:ABC transporter permease [Victivallales bacterium]